MKFTGEEVGVYIVKIQSHLSPHERYSQQQTKKPANFSTDSRLLSLLISYIYPSLLPIIPHEISHFYAEANLF